MLAPMSELTALPACFAAGTTVVYRRTLADYAANNGWTLTLHLAGVNVLSTAGVASGADHVITLTAANTATLGAGVYTWSERVTKGVEAYVVASGTVVVEPNLATATAGQLQSFEEKELAAVEAALASLITSGHSSYQIHGRAVTFADKLELMKIRDALVLRIQRRKRGGKLQTILYRFTGASQE